LGRRDVPKKLYQNPLKMKEILEKKGGISRGLHIVYKSERGWSKREVSLVQKLGEKRRASL